MLQGTVKGLWAGASKDDISEALRSLLEQGDVVRALSMDERNPTSRPHQT